VIRLNRAIVSGVRYIANSPPIKTVLAAHFCTGLSAVRCRR